jgi:hypothetical protein
MGLLPVGLDAAEGLYRLVDAAYERRSVAVSSNLPSWLGNGLRRPGRRRRHDRPHRPPRGVLTLKGASYRLRGSGIDSLPSIRTQNQAD